MDIEDVSVPQPEAGSKSGYVNMLDWKKTARFFLVGFSGLMATFLTQFLGATYTWTFHGVIYNFTAFVVLIIASIIEILRRFAADNTK